MSFNEAILACNQNKNAAECFLENASLNPTELAYDETADNNLRYFGANPNNYVSFNNELWRIIGVMNNIEDESGKKETKIKLVRNESIGSYSILGMPTEDVSENDWAKSALYKMLIGPYFNRTSGTCPSYSSTTSCNFSNSGLSNEARNMLSTSLWNVGGISTTSILASELYSLERKANSIAGSSSTVLDNVGLIYPSDYAFAVGADKDSRENCLNKALNTWSDVSECYQNDWLNKGNNYWTITDYTTLSYMKVYILGIGRISYDIQNANYNVYPSVYLKNNIKISGGSGSSSDPYRLEI